MTQKPDYYQLLGLSSSASQEDIKKAYRKMAMTCHPDRHPNNKEAEKKFRDITEAYDVLKDEQKRAAYDRYGHQAFDQNGFGGGSGFHGQGGQAGHFSDIFEEMFGEFMGGGRRARASAARKGSDIRYDMTISLEEAFTGLEKNISFNTIIQCNPCKGTGSASDKGSTTCGTCHGHGVTRMQQGLFSIERPCHRCNGSGQMIKDPCKTCQGQGRVRGKKELKVNIPAGIDTGNRIRLSGEGEQGAFGGPKGDLYIFVQVENHSVFTREEQNLILNATIPMVTATLGGEIEVPTIEGGKAKLNIPEGTQTARRFRLKDKGMSILRRSTRGDLFVIVNVETPVNLSEKQKDLLRQFNEDANKHSPQSQRFSEKLKKFWGNLTH